MSAELLLAWGVAQATGFLFKPVLEDLAKDAGKDVVKGYVEKSFGSVFKAASKDSLTKAHGKAIKELLQLIQDELIVNGVAESQVAAWNDDVKLFIQGQGVQQVLREAFSSNSAAVDAGLLAKSWQQMPNGPHPLPAEFGWPRIAKLFSQKVRNIREEEKELRDLLAAQATVETAEAIRNQTGIAPDLDLEKYRESLLESHQHLKLELLDPNGSSYKVQLRSVFVPQNVRDCQEYVPQVFEIPKEHLARLRKAGGLDEAMLDLNEELIESRRRGYLDQSPRSVLEVVADNRHSHLVILGSPGSGKSTLLKALALEWAQTADATERAARPLPLFIELNRYNQWPCSSGKSFARYLHEAQIVCRVNQGRLDEILKRQGGAVMLLDGLDEIFDAKDRENALNDIHRFRKDYPDTPVIVTSRIIGYQQRRLNDAGFRHFMLQDLEDAQIEEFLDRWHQTFVSEARDRDAKRRRLAEAIRDSRAIRELADNPLLLTMMSILNLHQELPRDRVQLYEQASRVLLHQWDVERLGLKVTLDYKEKAEMLRRLALRMQSAPGGLKGNLIAGDELEQLFRDYFKQELEHPDPRNAAREMVRQLRERNYILCLLGQDNFAFVHRTLLEYFCASALVRQSLRDKSSVDFLKREVFGPHWRDESWHEVLRLIAGMDDHLPVERVAEIIDFLLEEKDEDCEFHNIFLASQCFQEVRNQKAIDASRERIIFALTKLLRFNSSYPDEMQENTAQQQDLIRIKVINSLANLLTSDPHSWLKHRAAQDADYALREGALKALARGWRDDPETLPLLKQAAQDNSSSLRQTAIQELGRGWKDNPDILPILKQRVTQDNHPAVRQTAVEELARGWKNDPDTLPWLKQHACHDEHDDVRRASLQELMRGWRDNSDILPLLKDRARLDDSWVVRRIAVQELVRGWKEDSDTLLFLKARAQNDDDKEVHSAIVEELARVWPDDPEVKQLIEKLHQEEVAKSKPQVSYH